MIRADGFRPRKIGGISARRAKACALRAPTTSNLYGCTASAQVERGFLGKPEAGVTWRTISQYRKRFTPRSSIVHGWPYHPYASDDPRGRLPSAQDWRHKREARKGLRAARANHVQIERMLRIRST
jgi:hypothetical protein